MKPSKSKQPKYRISQWLDASDTTAKSLPIKYGIQINHSDGKGWKHLAEDYEALIYTHANQAHTKIDELKLADLSKGSVKTTESAQMTNKSVGVQGEGE